MKILAVIPARGGSKGIPRKNIKFIAGKPLIYYSINNALNCKYITDVVVTTDDHEIASIAKMYGAKTIMRGEELSADDVTLDPVIYDATVKMENISNYKYDIVITLQPTSPLLTISTLDNALKYFIDNSYDTVISAVNSPHLAWGKNNNGFFPMYQKRLNRQQLPPYYLEAGAFLISNRYYVTENSRMGEKISIYEMPDVEAVDIDNISDWIVCESRLKSKRIFLRCDGYKEIGMGHISHCITLAHNLTGHDVLIVTTEKSIEGIKKLEESFLKFKIVKNDEEFLKLIENNNPDIVVNDCLDTNKEYILKLKQLCNRVITIEDLGEGSKYADAVINALYSDNVNNYAKNVYSGHKYICLRDEFLLKKPKNFSEKVSNVVVLFGGTDPLNNAKRIYNAIKNYNYGDIRFNFIVGIGYNCEEHDLYDIPEKNIYIYKNINNVSDYMQQADIAFTSQGRTVYELASLGVPSIVMAQNERELLHTFAQMDNGFLNIGIGDKVSEDTILKTLDWLIKTPYIRNEMRNLMLKNDLKSGINNEIKIILGE
ncbi:MAG: UDP-2,4-diacetamido-2,4,6-trideoxy-beta-L-altropyranose hydrolase [Clostridium sp.]|nr:UDP-2,4-diacetamido-2,4,6-trideoxy-beta-L-altropyranose hydrolase [Clostridium sp.]MCM1444666.1 cytidyltransferase [Candidatus Amulumruptor caecigallinarius]